MDEETRDRMIREVVDDYRSSMLPVPVSLDDKESANRVFVGVTVRPEKILWQGLGNRARVIDAVCARNKVSSLAAIIDEDSISESLDKCVIPFCDEPQGLVRDRYRWAVSCLRGCHFDARELWANKNPDEALETLRVMTKSVEAAHFLVIHGLGKPASHAYSDDVKRAAVRLGLVSLADSVIEGRLESSLFEVLSKSDPDLVFALAFQSATCCWNDPRCTNCRAAVAGCWSLANGFV